MNQHPSAYEMWAKALNNEALSSHVGRLAGNIRYLNPEQRSALLAEAASRLDFAQPHRSTSPSRRNVIEEQP